MEPLTITKIIFKNELSAEINQTYEALIYATENSHSLACDDRRFYLEPIHEFYHDNINHFKLSKYKNSKILLMPMLLLIQLMVQNALN